MTTNYINNEYNHLKEKTVHGTPLLPFAKYSINTLDMLPFYPIHWHEEMEIIKVQRGQGKLFIEGTWYDANNGDIFILRPFAMHSINRNDDNEMELDAVVFNLRLLENNLQNTPTVKYFAPLLNDKNAIPCVVTQQDGWYDEFCTNVNKLLNQDITPEGADTIKAELYDTIYCIYTHRKLNKQTDVTEDKRCYTIKLALEYIRAHYERDITIQDVAKHCGYSEFYLMKLFKQYTGSSCVDYANNYRLTVAGKQLVETTDDISAVAHNVGFNNVSYFNRQFKKQYGTTPREFRKQKMQN